MASQFECQILPPSQVFNQTLTYSYVAAILLKNIINKVNIINKYDQTYV